MAAKGDKDKKGSGSAKKLQKKSALYEISGDAIKRKRKSCPKCGEGVFLAAHKDRESCGKCGYTEFKKREAKPVKEETPEKAEAADAGKKEKAKK